MAKKEKDVVRFLVQYMGLKDLLKRTNVQKILAGDASFSGSMAESDLDALKAARRYVDFISANLKIGDETIDRYFNRLQGVYTGADLSKRVGIHDADYPSYVAAVLATDKGEGKKKVSDAIIANEEVEKAVAGLPLALGKEKGLSYVATMTHYLALSASISGLNGNITELQRSNATEREKNKRLSELIAERTKRLADLEKVDAGFVALMEQTKKTASQDSVDAGFAAIASQMATLRDDIVKSIPTIDPAVLEGVKKSVRTSEQTVLKRLGTVEGKIVDGFKSITEQLWNANELVLTSVENSHRDLRRSIGVAQGVGIGETRKQGELTRQAIVADGISTRKHVSQVSTEIRKNVRETGDSINAHTSSEADRIIAEVKKNSYVKSGVWGKVITGTTAFILAVAMFFAGGAILNDNDYQEGSGSEVKIEQVDKGFEEKYNTYLAGVGADVDHYKAFVAEVAKASEDNVISKTEYATLSSKAAEAAVTADFPRTEMETTVLDNAIYSTELAQYDAVKGMIDGHFADKDFSIAEQAEVQTAIDGYNAENLEGKFNSAGLMSTAFDAAKEYSELNVLYSNLLNSQPGTETPAPNYSADMKDAMQTLQVALSDNSLSQEEVATLDGIIARLESTGDDNAELFAEKLDAVIDAFIAQIAANEQLASDKAAAEAGKAEAEQGKADAEAERDEWKAKYEEAQGKADELEDSVQELTDKVAELEVQLETNAAAAAKAYSELEALYNKAVKDYQDLYAQYQALVAENERIPELEQALVEAGNQIAALTEQIAQSKDIILDYYYQYTGTNGTLEEALAYFEKVNNTQSNQQGSSNADPEAPSYGR